MEIGGYRELDLRTGLEYYAKELPARLNMGRSGVYHATRCLGVNRVMLPYYQCETVRDFLIKKGIDVVYYHIDETMLPLMKNHDENTAMVIVNYFGILPEHVLQELVRTNKNVIIDNTQGFYQANLPGAYSVYSPRKFFGVPDGCYVIGENAQRYLDEYEQDFSANTASFLLSRIESGGNANYPQYQDSEARLEASDICRMSKLTYALLDNVDYDNVRVKRQANYDYAAKVFANLNGLSPKLLERSSGQVPMVYPLLIEQEDLRYILKANQVFVGQWWKYLLNSQEASAFEKKLSAYMLPIQIDQRYTTEEIDYTANLIFEAMKGKR